MEITVKLGGQLLPDTPRKFKLTLDGPITVLELANSLGLNVDEIGLIVINGIQSEIEDQLEDDCRVFLFPYLSGG